MGKTKEIPMSNKPVIDALKTALADTYTLQLKTQNYHWNVEGRDFAALHALFETQYNELFAAVDEIAERIRALDEKAPGTYAEFSKMTTLEEGDANLDEFGMVRDLYKSNQQITATLKKGVEKAESADDVSTADLLTGRITVHEKAAWMLKSTLAPDQRKKLAA